MRHTVGPEDFEARYHSWRGGALGLEHTLRQSAFLRPGNRGPRRGLYLVGGIIGTLTFVALNAEGKPVPDADAEEQRIFTEARKRALGKHFDEAAWKKTVKAEEWPKVVYVLNRGGRFEGSADERADGYEGDFLKARYGGMCAFYDPKVAAAKDSI